MSHAAYVKVEKLSSAFHSAHGALVLLGVNTFALLAFEQMGVIPSWVKELAALFLAL